MCPRPIAVTVACLCASPWAAALPARAQEPEPGVAVVVVGEPDEGLSGTAGRIDRVLQRAEGLRVPTDPGLRRALRGEEPDEGSDGLGRARNARAQLTGNESEDAPVLAEIGRMAGSRAVTAVRRRGGDVQVVVLDVGTGMFFEGALSPAAADDGELERFVRTRVAAAGEPDGDRAARGEEAAGRDVEPHAEHLANEGERDDVPPPGGDASQPSAGTVDAAPGAERSDGDEDDEPEEGSGLGEWALVIAGALLVGTIVLFTTTSESSAEPGPPVLRFVPGGGR